MAKTKENQSTADPSSSSSPQEDVREVWGTLSHGANPKSPLPAVVAVGTVPVDLGALGFTSVAIAASSIAAKMTSTAATANGGGVAAGSLVATLQSVEAAGLSVTSKVILGSAGTALGAWLGSPPSTPPAEHRTEAGRWLFLVEMTLLGLWMTVFQRTSPLLPKFFKEA
ncbi:interferon alpha-inducible protein 27-like protein 1 [Trachypithecus francoisi]|uniref:interferon alpha-inducible protein 27-like protein 1 n=1 Tax=Trachypithecus francoisi TaxID=54180 RepID=UPI00141B8E14|nr:interferon alpha-inducible protein 27-like protein 1 [Trachypithecus francoisi]